MKVSNIFSIGTGGKDWSRCSFCGERMDKELSDLILISCLNERCGKISRGKLCRVAKRDDKRSGSKTSQGVGNNEPEVTGIILRGSIEQLCLVLLLL